MTQEEIGKRIKMMRNIHAITQEELGKIIGVSSITISNYERGTIVPPTQRLLDLASFFHINPSYLLGDSNYLHEPGSEYHTPKKVPLIEQSVALNLPKIIAPYAKEYIDVPIDYTNNNTFAVGVLMEDWKVVVAERGNHKTLFLLCKSGDTIAICPRDKVTGSKKNIIAGVLHIHNS